MIEKQLVTSKGEDMAYYLWDKYEGNVPESESNISEFCGYGSVILSSPSHTTIPP